MNPIFTRISIHRCCVRRISGNSWLGLKCSGRHNVISLRKLPHLDCVKRWTPSHEALFAIRLEPGHIERYKQYHRDVWPEVLAAIRRSNIRNYSIFLKDDQLFGYYEYHGSDYDTDMANIAADPKTKEWWSIMMPMQRPLDTRRTGEWWAEMEEVFHCD